MRRIRSVGITIPCVIGPYTSLSCTLTLTKSTLRTSPLLADGYPRQGSDDNRFVDYFGATQSIVTSSGAERQRAVRGEPGRRATTAVRGRRRGKHLEAGAAAGLRPFDYVTISDVILHIRYTAREAGDPLGAASERTR